MNVASLNDYLQVAAHVVTILGLPLGLSLFYHEKLRERRDREYGTYNALDDKYIHFLELCLERPHLDVFDLPQGAGSDDEASSRERQEQVLFMILISILERAYLMYQDQSSEVRRRQWVGWVAYMEGYCRRANFRRFWPRLGPEFDTDFVAFMQALIDDATPSDTATSQTVTPPS